MVASERARAALADEVDDLYGCGRAKSDDVTEAPDLIGFTAIDRGENTAQRVEVAADVGDHGGRASGTGVKKVEELSWAEHRRVGVGQAEEVPIAGDEVVRAGDARERDQVIVVRVRRDTG